MSAVRSLRGLRDGLSNDQSENEKAGMIHSLRQKHTSALDAAMVPGDASLRIAVVETRKNPRSISP
jgi:hypothetical protein